jgi:hypothetical protein
VEILRDQEGKFRVAASWELNKFETKRRNPSHSKKKQPVSET